MDLSPTEDEAAFRSEVRSWLVEHLPWLPVVLALSANSPYLDGNDPG